MKPVIIRIPVVIQLEITTQEVRPQEHTTQKVDTIAHIPKGIESKRKNGRPRIVNEEILEFMRDKRDEGLTHRAICSLVKERFGIKFFHSQVEYYLKKMESEPVEFEEDQELPRFTQGKNRKKKITPEILEFAQTIKDEGLCTLQQIADQIKDKFGVEITMKGVFSALKKAAKDPIKAKSHKSRGEELREKITQACDHAIKHQVSFSAAYMELFESNINSYMKDLARQQGYVITDGRGGTVSLNQGDKGITGNSPVEKALRLMEEGKFMSFKKAFKEVTGYKANGGQIKQARRLLSSSGSSRLKAIARSFDSEYDGSCNDTSRDGGVATAPPAQVSMKKFKCVICTLNPVPGFKETCKQCQKSLASEERAGKYAKDNEVMDRWNGKINQETKTCPYCEENQTVPGEDYCAECQEGLQKLKA